MKKAIALTLICGGCCAMVLAFAQVLQANLSDAQAPYVLAFAAESLVTAICAWALFVLGVRTLASIADHDAEAGQMLGSILAVFRAIPMPASLRRIAARLAGL
mgnify:CR=1 FL=1